MKKKITSRTAGKAAIGAAAVGSAAIAAALLFVNRKSRKEPVAPKVPSGEPPETD